MNKKIILVLIVLFLTAALLTLFLIWKNINKQNNLLTNSERVKNFDDSGKKECTFTIGKKGQPQVLKGKIYIDGKKIKVSREAYGVKSYSVFDGATCYNWEEREDNSRLTHPPNKVSQNCIEENKKNYSSQEFSESKVDPFMITFGSVCYYDSPEEYISNNYLGRLADIECKPSKAVDFSVPESINFEDWCNK